MPCENNLHLAPDCQDERLAIEKAPRVGLHEGYFTDGLSSAFRSPRAY